MTDTSSYITPINITHYLAKKGTDLVVAEAIVDVNVIMVDAMIGGMVHMVVVDTVVEVDGDMTFSVTSDMVVALVSDMNVDMGCSTSQISLMMHVMVLLMVVWWHVYVCIAILWTVMAVTVIALTWCFGWCVPW